MRNLPLSGTPATFDVSAVGAFQIEQAVVVEESFTALRAYRPAADGLPGSSWLVETGGQRCVRGGIGPIHVDAEKVKKWQKAWVSGSLFGEIVQLESFEQPPAHIGGNFRLLRAGVVEVDGLVQSIYHYAAILAFGDMTFDLLAEFLAGTAIHVITNGGQQFFTGQMMRMSRLVFHEDPWFRRSLK
jgi:hypothetical protein